MGHSFLRLVALVGATLALLALTIFSGVWLAQQPRHRSLQAVLQKER